MGADPVTVGPNGATRAELQFDIDRRRREIEEFGIGGAVPEPGFTTLTRRSRGLRRGGPGPLQLRSTIVAPKGKVRIHGGFSTEEAILGKKKRRGMFGIGRSGGTGTGIGTAGNRGFR